MCDLLWLAVFEDLEFIGLQVRNMTAESVTTASG
jgi:hypothetical protein